MTVLRTHRHERNFTILGNPTIRNHGLSFRARGLLVFLLSQEDGFPVNAAELAKEAPEGRDAIVTALKELEAKGYLARRREQGERGRWRTFTDVYETPELGATDNGFPGVGENRRSEHITAGRTDNGLSDVGEPVAIEKGLSEKDKELLPTATVAATRPRMAAANDATAPTSRDLLREHLDALGHDLATKGQLAATIKRLLSKGLASVVEVRAALALMRDRGLTHPSVLPALVDELRGPKQNGHRNGNGRLAPSSLPEADLSKLPPRGDVAALDAWADAELAGVGQ